MVEVKFVLLNNEEFEPVFKEFRLFAKDHPDKIPVETVALAKSKYLNLIVAELAVANEYFALVEGLKNVLVEVKKEPVVVEKAQKVGQKAVKPVAEEDEFDDEDSEEDTSDPEEMDL